MNKKVLIFSLTDFYVNEPDVIESQIRPITFLQKYKDHYDFYLLLTHTEYDLKLSKKFNCPHNLNEAKRKYVTLIKSIINNIKIIELNIDNFVKKVMTTNTFYLEKCNVNIREKFDILITYHNVIDLSIAKYGIDKFRNPRTLKMLLHRNIDLFDYSLYYITLYNILNEFFKSFNSSKIQLLEDPLDIKFDGFKIYTSDIENDNILKKHGYSFAPFQQYYFFKYFKKKSSINKDIKFIVSNTLSSKNRLNEFEKYIADIYNKEKYNKQFKFIFSGIIDNEYLYLKNPVNNHEVPKFVIRSKFGLLLSTYHGKIISANKLSLFLSNDCVPLIVRNCDDESQLIPKELKDQIEIKDGECLKKIINDSSNYERLLLSCKKKFHKYQSRKYYEEHFKRLLS